MTPDRLAVLRAQLERAGVIKPRVIDPDGYDGKDDFEKSINACYQAIRERVAAGGPAWELKE